MTVNNKLGFQPHKTLGENQKEVQFKLKCID